ncbi:uncharacterized protein ACIQIH_005656 isoform 2-T3 [Cyanocitta cristata]
MYSPALWRRKLSAVCSFLSRCLFLRRDRLGTPPERDARRQLRCCGELPSAIENISLLKERREEEDHHNIAWGGFNLAENSRNSTTGESGGRRTDPWPLVYSPLPPLCGGTGPLLHAAAEAAGAAGSAGHLQPGRGGIIQLHVLRGEEAGLAPRFWSFSLGQLQVPVPGSGLQTDFSDTCRLEGKNQNKTEKRKEPLNFPPLAADPRWAGIQCVVGKVLVLGKTSAVPCAAQQMARVCWWFSSKAIELLDAVLILRKKQEQVTFLHVYHHGSMLFSWWSGVKYVPGGQAFFTGMLNSFVHIFMNDHFALASLGLRKRQHMWWKHYLTILQLTGARA